MFVNNVNKKDQLHYRLWRGIKEGVRTFVLITYILLLTPLLGLLILILGSAGALLKLMGSKPSVGNVTQTKLTKKELSLKKDEQRRS